MPGRCLVSTCGSFTGAPWRDDLGPMIRWRIVTFLTWSGVAETAPAPDAGTRRRAASRGPISIAALCWTMATATGLHSCPSADLGAPDDYASVLRRFVHESLNQRFHVYI